MKRLFILFFTVLICSSALAQRDGQTRERIKAQKVAFITERLDLTPAEAQKFWPIYNAYEDQVTEIRRNDLKKVRESMRKGDLSESEANTILDLYMSAENRKHDAAKSMINNLRAVIPPQKIIALKAAEEAFNRMLMNRLRERKENKQKNKE